MRTEGFSEIHFVATEPGKPAAQSLGRGEIVFTANFSPPLIMAIDAGNPITLLGGEHIGCFELS